MQFSIWLSAALALCPVVLTFSISTTSDAITLANAAIGNVDLVLNNAQYVGSGVSAGTFIDGPLQIGTGLALSSGNVQGMVPGGGSTSNVEGTAGSSLCSNVAGGTSYDAAVLTMSISLPEDYTGFTATYIYGSTDYSPYNDVMVIYVDGMQIGLFGGQPLTVQTLENNPATLFPPANGISYNRGSPLLSSTFNTSPGEHIFQVAVCDTGDSAQDSGGLFKLAPKPSRPFKLHLSVDTDTGTSSTDGVTDVPDPVLLGQADPLTIVYITVNGIQVPGSATPTPDGTFTFPLPPLSPGQNTIQAFGVFISDSSQTPLSTPFVVTFTPVAPTLLLDPISDSGILGDGSTTSTILVFHGTGLRSHDITVIDTLGASVGDVLSNPDGTWTLTTGQQSLGTHQYQAINDPDTYSVGPSNSVSLDIVPIPSPPILTGITPETDTGVKGDLQTAIQTPIFTGTALRGAFITLYEGSNIIGTGIADVSGSFAIQAITTLSSLAQHSIVGTQLSVEGNLSPLSNPPLVLRIVPAAPVITGISPDTDTGILGDFVTSARRIYLVGTGVPNQNVILFDADGVVAGGQTNGMGAFSLETSILEIGTYSFTAVLFTINGYVSAPSEAREVEIITPEPPPVSSTTNEVQLMSTTGVDPSTTDFSVPITSTEVIDDTTTTLTSDSTFPPFTNLASSTAELSTYITLSSSSPITSTEVIDDTTTKLTSDSTFAPFTNLASSTAELSTYITFSSSSPITSTKVIDDTTTTLTSDSTLPKLTNLASSTEELSIITLSSSSEIDVVITTTQTLEDLATTDFVPVPLPSTSFYIIGTLNTEVVISQPPVVPVTTQDRLTTTNNVISIAKAQSSAKTTTSAPLVPSGTLNTEVATSQPPVIPVTTEDGLTTTDNVISIAQAQSSAKTTTSAPLVPSGTLNTEVATSQPPVVPVTTEDALTTIDNVISITQAQSSATTTTSTPRVPESDMTTITESGKFSTISASPTNPETTSTSIARSVSSSTTPTLSSSGTSSSVSSSSSSTAQPGGEFFLSVKFLASARKRQDVGQSHIALIGNVLVVNECGLSPPTAFRIEDGRLSVGNLSVTAPFSDLADPGYSSLGLAGDFGASDVQTTFIADPRFGPGLIWTNMAFAQIFAQFCVLNGVVQATYSVPAAAIVDCVPISLVPVLNSPCSRSSFSSSPMMSVTSTTAISSIGPSGSPILPGDTKIIIGVQITIEVTLLNIVVVIDGVLVTTTSTNYITSSVPLHASPSARIASSSHNGELSFYTTTMDCGVCQCASAIPGEITVIQTITRCQSCETPAAHPAVDTIIPCATCLPLVPGKPAELEDSGRNDNGIDYLNFVPYTQESTSTRPTTSPIADSRPNTSPANTAEGKNLPAAASPVRPANLSRPSDEGPPARSTLRAGNSSPSLSHQSQPTGPVQAARAAFFGPGLMLAIVPFVLIFLL